MSWLKVEIRTLKIWKAVGLVLLFIAFLSTVRLLWIHTFAGEEKAQIEKGILDLRDVEGEEQRILALDGEWQFYPSTFLMDGEEGKQDFIQVPGDWSAHLPGAEDSSYGYGTYRLQILVPEDDETTYSIHVPSVRSASSLYVNGDKLDSSGVVGKNGSTYEAKNLPYAAAFIAEDGVIDIVIEVANFRDPRASGLIRSIKFSAKELMKQKTDMSTGLQLAILVIFFIHSLYAVILYFLGSRDKRLIYFSLFVFSSMFMFGLGLEDKFLHIWLGIDYTLAFRLSTIALIAVGYFLFKCIQDLLSELWRKVLIIYEIACLLSVIVIAVLPLRTFLEIQEVHFLLTIFAFMLATYVVFKVAIQQEKHRWLLFLSLISFFHNALWSLILLFNGIKTMYYPFDLAFSVICLAAFWFKQYFDMHRETERISRKLQEADQMKDDFLVNTSHELKNPLHAMLNISHAVLEREKGHLEMESVNDLETVLSVGRRMSTMVNDLLDVATLKQKTPRLTKSIFLMQSVTTGVLDMLEYLTEGKRIQLENNVPDDLPAVYADENRIIQVLFNLVHNGIKNTEKGTVSVTGYVKNGRVYIEVQDTGIGISAEELPNIFDSYEQGNVVLGGGFGLGLSISKKLVELHGGTIEVTSEVHQGSTFVFSVQRSDAKDVLEEKQIQPQHILDISSKKVDGTTSSNPVIALSSKRPKVLVVDDDGVNLQVVKRILTAEKYDITTVMSGEEALAILHKKHWDLVIADVMMPRMSGYALTREIRKRFSITELPILLLTARVQMADIEEGFNSGANDYVAKPVEPLELRSRVQALTSVRKSMYEHLRMEAAWLQAQIQPHFLFNALNTIMALSQMDSVRMKGVLEAFSEFLRGKFNFQNVDDLIPIQNEIDLIEAYLTIEKARFGDRLEVQWEIDDLDDVSIPPLTIQPLVENAIHHGLMSDIKGGTLRIRIHKHDSSVSISVEDDGVGMTEAVKGQLLQRNEGERTGVGLLNTHIRLKRQFNSGLHIESTLGKGTKISFVIPLMSNEK